MCLPSRSGMPLVLDLVGNALPPAGSDTGDNRALPHPCVGGGEVPAVDAWSDEDCERALELVIDKAGKTIEQLMVGNINFIVKCVGLEDASPIAEVREAAIALLEMHRNASSVGVRDHHPNHPSVPDPTSWSMS